MKSLKILQVIHRYKLNAGQAIVLIGLGARESTSSSIAAKYKIEKNNVNPYLHKLRQLGYIDRQTNFKAFNYFLTDRGKEILKRIIEIEKQ